MKRLVALAWAVSALSAAPPRARGDDVDLAPAHQPHPETDSERLQNFKQPALPPTAGSTGDRWVPPIALGDLVPAQPIRIAMVNLLILLLLASHAGAEDREARMNRTTRSGPASNVGSHPPTCSGCIQACRRNGGPMERICEALCLETCRNR